MIDLDALRQAIRGMNSRQKLYKLLKEELFLLGHWKNRPRGNPKKGYAASKTNKP